MTLVRLRPNLRSERLYAFLATHLTRILQKPVAFSSLETCLLPLEVQKYTLNGLASTTFCKTDVSLERFLF